MVWDELRTAVRFPLHLPLLLTVDGEPMDALTVNISNNGVLLQVPRPISRETRLDFLLSIPSEAAIEAPIGAIHCSGHVIRAYEENGCAFAAVIIDEYQFQ
jgi:hypothetical protein